MRGSRAKAVAVIAVLAAACACQTASRVPVGGTDAAGRGGEHEGADWLDRAAESGQADELGSGETMENRGEVRDGRELPGPSDAAGEDVQDGPVGVDAAHDPAQGDGEGDAVEVAQPPDCCVGNEDCEPGLKCVFVPGWTEGKCEPVKWDGSCWSDEDCGPESECQGELVCPCTLPCGEPDHTGKCKPWQVTPCCESSAECEEGFLCAANPDPTQPGSCLPAPVPGMCYSQAECGEKEICVAEMVCSCEQLGPVPGCNVPGWCKELPPGCCMTTADCDDGEVCVAPPWVAECKPAPLPGECYGDEYCEPGQKCVGDAYCGCGGVCSHGTSPGKCEG